VIKTQKFANRSRFSVSVASAVLGLAMISNPAFAQEAADEETAKDEIVVTGTLISNPNLKQATPVISTSSDEIQLQQTTVAEELLREIPGIVPSIGAQVNNGNGGASFVNLRGQGTNRNIVLLDGNRITPAGLNGVFDLNNVPVALVERVDVTTGGAVTTYGADAITGVVNFITRRDFSGAEVNLTEQLSQKGDGNTFGADVTVGANLDDGRGNVVFSVGYQESDPIYQGGRAISIDNIDSYSGTAGGSGTAVPSRFSLPGVGTRSINPTTGALQGGFVPFNFNPYNIFQTPFKRFNIYGAARYEISDAVEVYTRGLFSKNTVETIIAPSGVFASTVTIPVSNPFLPVPARNQFCAANGITPAACAAAAAATSPADPNYRTFDTVLRRRFTETGPRISNFGTTVFDYQVGARGGITDAISWDIRGAYGQSENVQTLQGYVLTSRVRDALLATNATSCLSGAQGCVPLNVFGPGGSITPEMAAYAQSPSTTTVKTSLAQVRAVINGETGFVVPMAEDAVNFAVGAEYRKYGAEQVPDSLSQIPGELGGAGGAAPQVKGGYEVKELIGEVNIPLVQGKPGFENLTVGAGIRHSSYKVDAAGSPKFSATTYKFEGAWEPVDSLKVRGTYSRAVRAPNIGELFSPVSTGLTNLATDPCAGLAPTLPANANLRAVCLAQGAPAGIIGAIANPTAGQANSTGGGNVNLRPETANTWTAGFVATPFSGFSASLDYYNIKVNGAVSSPTPADVINACFSGLTAASATSAACTSIRRNPTTGALDGDPATTLGLPQTLSNLGKLATDGFDLSLNYKRDIGFAKLGLSFTGNYTMNSKFQATPTALDRECTGFYSVNCGSIQPKFQWTQRTTLSFESIDVSLLWRHIDKVKFEPQQLADDLAAAIDGGCTGITTAADVNSADPDGCLVDPAFRNIKAADYFDLSTRFSIGDNVTLTFTVENLLGKKPPAVGSTIGSTSYNSGNTYPSTYDALGRFFSVGARLKF
jgi:iron complex outermembrane recepter protein